MANGTSVYSVFYDRLKEVRLLLENNCEVNLGLFAYFLTVYVRCFFVTMCVVDSRVS